MQGSEPAGTPPPTDPCPECGRPKPAGRACPACVEDEISTGFARRFGDERRAQWLRRWAWALGLLAVLVLAVFEHRPVAALIGGLAAAGAVFLWSLGGAVVRRATQPVSRELFDLRRPDSASVPVRSTVNVLLLSDTHGARSCLATLDGFRARHRLDGVILAGDFTEFGQFGEALLERIRDLGLPCAFVSGNHESPELCVRFADEYGFERLDGRSVRFLGLELVGIGGWDMFTSDREERIRLQSGMSPAELPDAFRVLVSHQPPSPWVRGGRDLGSEALGRLLQRARFDLVVAGHIHEQVPASARGPRGEAVLNPGPRGFLVAVDPAGHSMEILPGP